MQTRYYDPVIGRFISRDSYAYVGANGDLGSFNLFAYCSNNPVKCVDSSGEFGLLTAAIVIGAGMLIGGVTGAYTAAATDGNVVEGAIEGALTGGGAAAIGYITAPLNPIISITASLAGGAAYGATIDIATQTVSHGIENGNFDNIDYDWVRVAEVAGATAISAAVPMFTNVQSSTTMAIGSAIVGADVSLAISSGQIIAHKSCESYGFSFSQTTTQEMYLGEYLTNWMENYKNRGIYSEMPIYRR